MRPLLWAVLAVSLGVRASAAPSCPDAYEADYEPVWELARADWDAACARGEAPEKILAAGQKAFAARCADGARPSIAAGLTNAETVKGLCAQGASGRAKIPRPGAQGAAGASAGQDGAVGQGLSQGGGAVDGLGKKVGSFVSEDIAGLYGERTMAEPVAPAQGSGAGSGAKAAGAIAAEKGFKAVVVPAVGDAAARTAAVDVLRKRVVIPAGVKDPAVVGARVDALFGVMFAGSDPSLIQRMNASKVTIIVIPAGKKLTDYAPFSKLKGKKTFDGRPWDDVRGVADVPMDGGGVACAVPEENLLGKDTGYPKDYVFVHEVGHMIQDYGITNAQRAEAIKIYGETVRRKQKTGLGAYGDANVSEFWAQGTAAFFGRPNNGQPVKTAAQLKKANEPLYDLLVRVHGPPPAGGKK